MWLNEKYVKEQLDHKNLREITTKYHSDHRKNRHELDNKLKKQCIRIFRDATSAIRVIMDCRTTSTLKIRTRLGFKQYDIILRKEQSVLTKIISSSVGKNMQAQYNVLSYRIDLYFDDYKLAIKDDENGHRDVNIDYQVKGKKQ